MTSPSARSWQLPLAWVVGLLLLAVGAGLGPRHARVEGWSAMTVVGLVLMAAGLVTALWAAVHVLAGTRRRWWTVTVPLMLLSAYLALWTLGQAVAASYPPRPVLGERTPADVGLAYGEVTFDSSDGVQLAGWWIGSRNGAAVALLHGAGSTRSAVLDHAQVLAEHGYGVLLFDARGHGESQGPGMDFGWYGEPDVIGALDFLARQPDVSPGRVGLVGLSMGGEQAIGAAGVDDRVVAVVAEGATHRVADDKGYLGQAYGARGEVQQGIDRATYWLVDILSRAPEPQPLRASVAAADGLLDSTAFLLITAGEVPDEEHAARYIRGSRDEADVEIWTVPGAGHTGGLETAPQEWERRVTTFLDHSLGGAPS